jgi:hypothetical protein
MLERIYTALCYICVLFLLNCSNTNRHETKELSKGREMLLEGSYNISDSKLDARLEKGYFDVFDQIDYQLRGDTIYELDYYASDDKNPVITRYLRKHNPTSIHDKKYLMRLDSNVNGKIGYVLNFERFNSHDYYVVQRVFAPASFILVYHKIGRNK